MHLWLVKRIGPVDYDEYEGFLIRAESEQRAREMAEAKRADEEKGTWADPERSSCTLVTAEGAEEILLEDFNAG